MRWWRLIGPAVAMMLAVTGSASAGPSQAPARERAGARESTALAVRRGERRGQPGRASALRRSGRQNALRRKMSAEHRSTHTTIRAGNRRLRFEGTVSPRLRARIELLWRRYADEPKVSRAIREFFASSTFEHRAANGSDEDYVLGHLIDVVPPTARRARPVPPLKVSAIEVETGPKHHVRQPLRWIERGMASASDIVIAPEWLFVPARGFYSEREFRAIRAALVRMSRGSDRLLVPGTIAWRDDGGRYHNTALAISNGVILKRYDKRIDGEDKDLAARFGAEWAPGHTDGLFEWRGLRVGLEICRDHGDGSLRWDLLARRQAMVDVQLVVSAGVSIKHPAVGVGGVVIVAQGSPEALGGVGVQAARRGQAPGPGRGLEPSATSLGEHRTAAGVVALYRL